MSNVILIMMGALAGGGIAWLVTWAAAAKNNERLRNAEGQVAIFTGELRLERATGVQLRAEAERAKATLEAERKAFEKQRALVAEKEKQLKESSSAWATEALHAT